MQEEDRDKSKHQADGIRASGKQIVITASRRQTGKTASIRRIVLYNSNKAGDS